MKPRFSPTAFMIAYCLTYAVALGKDMPLFRYFPLYGTINWGPGIVKSLGPAMAWYGIMADAAIIAVIVALIVPQRIFDKMSRNVLWVIPCATLLTTVYLMKRFFA